MASSSSAPLLSVRISAVTALPPRQPWPLRVSRIRAAGAREAVSAVGAGDSLAAWRRRYAARPLADEGRFWSVEARCRATASDCGAQLTGLLSAQIL